MWVPGGGLRLRGIHGTREPNMAHEYNRHLDSIARTHRASFPIVPAFRTPIVAQPLLSLGSYVSPSPPLIHMLARLALHLFTMRGYVAGGCSDRDRPNSNKSEVDVTLIWEQL